MYFDTHAHFDTFVEAGEVDAVLARAAAAGVSNMCAVGGSGLSNEVAVRLARVHPEVLVCAVGYDRDQVDKPHDPARLAALAGEAGVVAIGEIGLDYYYAPETATRQRALFEQMLALALDRRRPVVVHSRQADGDTRAMLEEFSTEWKKKFHGVENPPPPGILHCFTGGAAFAEELLALDMRLSFSGILSFNNAEDLRDTARRIPADRLLIETDCPYLTPKPFRGKGNEPMYVARVADVLADVRGISVEELATVSTANARAVFQMEDVQDE
ncbi:MAG: TatD family hydrolase [Verrucomicrobiota bacterium]|jgi:TatD DNase family protein|nr:TatD family hydrolase [Verrucomicrobiota bacterium]